MVGTLQSGNSLNGIRMITLAQIRSAFNRVVLATVFASVWFVILYFWNELTVQSGGVLNSILWVLCLIGAN